MNGRYQFTASDKLYYVKMSGNLRYTGCANFDSFLTRLFKEHLCEDIIIDLSEAEFLDSTNLGLMAKAAGFVMKKCGRKMTVISSNESVNDLLTNTGFDQVINIIETIDLDQARLDDLPIPEQERNMAAMLLEAHEALIDMNDENIAQFKDVVEMLRRETPHDGGL